MGRTASVTYEHYNHEFNKRFRELRNLLNHTQKGFAERIDIKPSTISDIERGRIKVSNNLIEKISSIFNVNSGWFYTGEGNVFNVNSQGRHLGLNQGNAGNSNETEPWIYNIMTPFQINHDKAMRLKDAPEFKKQEAIVNKLISKNLIDKEFGKIRNSVFSIANSEDIMSDLRDAEPINMLLHISVLTVKTMGLSHEQTEKFINEHINKLKPYFHIFNELSEALTKFAKQASKIPPEISGLDIDYLKQFIKIIS